MTSKPPPDQDRDGALAAGERILTLSLHQAGARLDAALTEALATAAEGERKAGAQAAPGTDHPALSRARCQALIRAGHVRLDGTLVTAPNLRLSGGECVALTLPAPVPATPEPEAIPIDIVFEDDDLLVVNKPSGLVVHPGAGHGRGTLVNALLYWRGATLSGIGGVARPGIVHRLDKDTSGLLVVAKTDRAHHGLAAQFADHGRSGPLERVYEALIWGAPRRARDTIDAAIGRAVGDRYRFAVVKRGGKPARTHYTVTQSYGRSDAEPLVCRLSCQLDTGRTHQIRVHLAHLGHPLLGDPLYGAGYASKIAKLPPSLAAHLAALPGQALHAGILGFAHPISGSRLQFQRPPPPAFTTLRDELEAWTVGRKV